MDGQRAADLRFLMTGSYSGGSYMILNEEMSKYEQSESGFWTERPCLRDLFE